VIASRAANLTDDVLGRLKATAADLGVPEINALTRVSRASCKVGRSRLDRCIHGPRMHLAHCMQDW
jgi:hypothetical protein